MYGRGKKLSKPKTQNINKNPFKKKEIKDRINRDIWRLFEREKKKKKESNQKKKTKLIID